MFRFVSFHFGVVSFYAEGTRIFIQLCLSRTIVCSLQSLFASVSDVQFYIAFQFLTRSPQYDDGNNRVLIRARRRRLLEWMAGNRLICCK